MEKIKKIVDALKSGNWEEGQNLWMDLLAQGIEKVEPLKDAMQELSRRGQHKLALELLNLTVSSCAEANKPSLWLDSLRLLSQYNPADKKLVKQYTQAFLETYHDRTYLKDWVNKIQSKNYSPTKYIETLDKLILFKKNSVVKHKSGWGIGKVREIDNEKMEMIVDLENHKNHRIEIFAASDCLIPLEDDNFEALRAYNPEFLKEEAHEKPLELLYRVLKFHNEPVSSKEIKEYLCPKVIEEKEWSKWWTHARKLLLNDPYVETGESSHAKYSLRKEPMAWEDEIKSTFDKAEAMEKPLVVLEYLKHADAKQNYQHFCSVLSQQCKEYLSKGKLSYALEVYLIIQECNKKASIKVDQSISLSQIVKGNAIPIFNNVRIPALAPQTLEILLEEEPTFEHHLSQIFKKTSDLGRDTLYKYLNKNAELMEKYLGKVCREIFYDPLGYPDALIWLAKQIFASKIQASSQTKDPSDSTVSTIPSFFDVLQLLISTGGTLKALRQVESVKKINKIFSINLAKKIVENVDNVQAPQLLKSLEEANFLPYTFKQTLQQNLRDKYKDLGKQIQYIYTTKAGLNKYQRELEDLMLNKYEQNRKAIGEALSFGDISENAELDAAREIQWQLTNKAKEMQNNIARAMVIDFNTLDTNIINIGTQVTLQDEQGKKIQYTILGPWDVKLDKGIISYMSEIAKKLLGGKLQESVDLPAGKFQIVSIDKYKEEA
ncbi:MAG: GreA/GreB family elongation factor [Candidatus Brocadiae bacterium]|nr:GreA/GreB family elongation factor [Candidatus Brocadiia bacterium]